MWKTLHDTGCEAGLCWVRFHFRYDEAELMKCPTCEKEGLEPLSFVQIDPSKPFPDDLCHFDEDGTKVPQSKNSTTTVRYLCTNNHSFTKKFRDGNEIDE